MSTIHSVFWMAFKKIFGQLSEKVFSTVVFPSEIVFGTLFQICEYTNIIFPLHSSRTWILLNNDIINQFHGIFIFFQGKWRERCQRLPTSLSLQNDWRTWILKTQWSLRWNITFRKELEKPKVTKIRKNGAPKFAIEFAVRDPCQTGYQRRA